MKDVVVPAAAALLATTIGCCEAAQVELPVQIPCACCEKVVKAPSETAHLTFGASCLLAACQMAEGLPPECCCGTALLVMALKVF